MKLTVTEKEIQQLYAFTASLKREEANKVFNSIFTNNHLEMIGHSMDRSSRTLTISIDEDVSEIFLETFIKNGSKISNLLHSNKVSLLCNIRSVFDGLVKDIIVASDVARKLWNRKQIPDINTNHEEENCKEYSKGCTDF